MTLPHGHFKLSTLALLRDLVRLANSASSLASSSGVRSRFTGPQYSSQSSVSRKLAPRSSGQNYSIRPLALLRRQKVIELETC